MSDIYQECTKLWLHACKESDFVTYVCAVLASLDTVEVIPDVCGLAGSWVKVLGKTTPNFGPVDKILKAGFFVEQVRHKIVKCDVSWMSSI